MSPSLYNENIKINITLTDENGQSVMTETTTKVLKEMHEKHNIWGMDMIFCQLYNELTQK